MGPEAQTGRQDQVENGGKENINYNSENNEAKKPFKEENKSGKKSKKVLQKNGLEVGSTQEQ